MKRRNKFLSCLFLVFLLPGVVPAAQTDSAAQRKLAGISGIVTNSLTGEPLAHARVLLDNGAGDQDCQLKTCPYGMTAADGRFVITSVVPGKYQMVVERRGFGPLADEQENRKPVEVKSGEDINDVVLQLVPDAVISGQVLDEKGIPVERFEVEAAGGGSKGFAVTGDRGKFRIGGLRAGRYLVKTEAISYFERRTPPEIRTDGSKEIYYSPTYYPSARDRASATPVEARAGEETGGIEIKLVPGPILRVSGAVSSVPQGADTVTVNLEENRHPYRSFTSAGPSFTFTFWGVPRGRYQVYADCFDAALSLMPGPPAEINVTNSNIEGIDLACAHKFELTGHVEVEGGAPFPDAKGGRAPSLKFLPLGSIYDPEPAEPINTDGTFKRVNVSPDRYHLIGEGLPDGFYVKSAHVGTTDLKDGILDLRNADPNEVLTVQLGVTGAEIYGVVRDAKGPAAGAHVTLFFDDEYGFDVAAGVVTGSDGTYALRGIAPARYKLVAYDAKSSAVRWSSDAVALHAAVTENIEAGEGDKILQDLKLLP